MRRLLIVVLIMFSIGASAQIQENLIRMSKDTTKFLVKYYPPQLIRLDSVLYALTHATLVGQSMRTVIDNGWAYKVGDGRGGSGGGSSQWGTNGSKIYYNSGNVGVGTSNPSQKFDIQGSLRVKDTIWLDTYGSHSPVWSLDGNLGIYARDGFYTPKLTVTGSNSTGYDYIYVKDNATGQVKTAAKTAGSDTTGYWVRYGTDKFAREVTNDGDNGWTVPFPLKANATIYYNDHILQSGQWSGTNTLTVTVVPKKYDKIYILN